MATQLTLPGLAAPGRTILHVDVDRFVIAAVARDLQRRRAAARHTVTIRFAPFGTRSHSVEPARPAVDPTVLEEAALRGLELFEPDRPVRLVGVRAALASPRPRPRRRRRRRPVGERLPGPAR